jgi:heme/copper-type cytochrome/quinol oxidase subunit 2
MGYLLLLLGGIILLVIGSVGVLAMIASGLGIPLLVFPVAWYFIWRSKKKDKEKEGRYGRPQIKKGRG